jgi:hypothetical protein
MLSPFIEGGMHPDEVAALVLAGILGDAEYVFTHAAYRALLAERFQRVLAAFDALPDADGGAR